MAGPVIFRNAEARFLRELNRRGVRYLVVGLSAANLHGAAVATNDASKRAAGRPKDRLVLPVLEDAMTTLAARKRRRRRTR